MTAQLGLSRLQLDPIELFPTEMRQLHDSGHGDVLQDLSDVFVPLLLGFIQEAVMGRHVLAYLSQCVDHHSNCQGGS